MEKIENMDICKKCGGRCCKKSGCNYLVSDFENLKLDVIENALQTGRVSIAAALSFKNITDDKIICVPILYLRARNKNRDIIDLFSFKSGCMSQTATGCYFDLEHRPGAGAAFIPEANGLCHSGINAIEEIKNWLPYQNILRKLVKKYTSKGVEQKLKEDVEDVLYKIYIEDYAGIVASEINDMLSCIKELSLAFPEENKKAYIKSQNTPVLMRK